MSGDVHTIVLPNGHRIAVNDGEKPRDAMLRHSMASMAEGICPYHGERMSVAPEPAADSNRARGQWSTHEGCPYYWTIETLYGEPAITQMAAWAYEGHTPPGWTP